MPETFEIVTSGKTVDLRQVCEDCKVPMYYYCDSQGKPIHAFCQNAACRSVLIAVKVDA